jgi:lariat debranching enzyme
MVNVAIEGCCHGELDTIYSTIAARESSSHSKVDLLLICGDFQCVSDESDLECVAMPSKYRCLFI